jgi:hypothetical protein
MSAPSDTRPDTGTPGAPGDPGGAGGAVGAAGPADSLPTSRQVAGRRWRRARGPLAAALLVIIVGTILAALQPRTEPGYLDPESAAKDGSRALARISGQRGTSVRVVRTAAAAAEGLRSREGALLVVVRSERLLPGDIDTLAAAPGDRLLVEPTRAALAKLAPGIDVAGRAEDTVVSPGCALPAATLAGSAEVSGRTYRAPATATRCYPSGGRHGLVRVPAGGRTVTVLGAGRPFTNRRLAEQGNAALGVNLLTGRADVVWLMPDVPAPGSGGGEKSLPELVPRGVELAFWQLLIAVLFVVLWRVRRLGPVVTEPLPVVVRSAEAVEGRARLYRSRRARDRAAYALRAGCLERLRPMLGLSRSAVQQSLTGDTVKQVEIVSAIAARAGADADTIGMALYGPSPEEDGEMVRLADFLDELEARVRRS